MKNGKKWKAALKVMASWAILANTEAIFALYVSATLSTFLQNGKMCQIILFHFGVYKYRYKEEKEKKKSVTDC